MLKLYYFRQEEEKPEQKTAALIAIPFLVCAARKPPPNGRISENPCRLVLKLIFCSDIAKVEVYSFFKSGLHACMCVLQKREILDFCYVGAGLS